VVRNVTFSLPVDLVRKAKILAAQQDKSLNAVVRDALERAVEGDRGYRSAGERLLKQSDSGLFDIPPERWTRDELHE
jgi:predicted transcriptional regulator